MENNTGGVVLEICGERHIIKEWIATVEVPLVKNDSLDFCANYYMIQNTGNTIIEMDDGWEIYPSVPLMLGNSDSLDMYVAKHKFKFGTVNVTGAGAIKNRLQIMRYSIKNIPCLSNYSPQV